MATIKEMIRKAEGEGYQDENAEAKVCQDIILKALSESPLSRNVTIKGGVVMRSLSGDARRVGNTFSSSQYVSRLSLSRKNWLGMDIPVVINGLLAFLKSI